MLPLVKPGEASTTLNEEDILFFIWQKLKVTSDAFMSVLLKIDASNAFFFQTNSNILLRTVWEAGHTGSLVSS